MQILIGFCSMSKAKRYKIPIINPSFVAWLVFCTFCTSVDSQSLYVCMVAAIERVVWHVKNLLMNFYKNLLVYIKCTKEVIYEQNKITAGLSYK